MNGGNSRPDLVDKKDTQLAQALERSSQWRELSKNHLEGRSAAFFCYGDRGGAALDTTGRPKILMHKEWFDPKEEPYDKERTRTKAWFGNVVIVATRFQTRFGATRMESKEWWKARTMPPVARSPRRNDYENRLGWELIQLIDFGYIFAPDLSRWGRSSWRRVCSGCRMRPGGRSARTCRVAGRASRGSTTARSSRASLHVLKTGCRWRDVPSVYGPPTTIYNRYNCWSQRRIWQRIFEKMAAAGPIPDELSIDSRHVKAHRSASGSKRGSLKKRSAARGAEGRARSMLWPMIAADRSLSRLSAGTSSRNWRFEIHRRKRLWLDIPSRHPATSNAL